jgi:hypothetical protein
MHPLPAKMSSVRRPERVGHWVLGNHADPAAPFNDDVIMIGLAST